MSTAAQVFFGTTANSSQVNLVHRQKVEVGNITAIHPPSSLGTTPKGNFSAKSRLQNPSEIIEIEVRSPETVDVQPLNDLNLPVHTIAKINEIKGVIYKISPDFAEVGCQLSEGIEVITLPIALLPEELRITGLSISVALDVSDGYRKLKVKQRKIDALPWQNEIAALEALVDSI